MQITASRQYAAAAKSPVARYLVLLLVLVGWFSITAWMRPLALPDEGRYAGVAWEMFASGQWGVPLLDGMPFFHKPPLYYWIAQAAMHVFGVGPFAARVPSILGASALGCVLYAFTDRWQGRRTADLAIVMLASTPFVFIGAQFANMDMLVASCIGVAILLAAHQVLLPRPATGIPWALLGAYVVCGLGVLAKGLIGAVLPALVILIWLAWIGRLRVVLTLVSVPGLLLFFAVCAPWLIAMQRLYPGFFDYFFLEQHLHRFAGSTFNNHEPIWFAAAVALVLCLPWTLFVFAKRSRASHPAANDALVFSRLMLVWWFVVVVFFSIPQSKLIGYVLPAAAPLVAFAALRLRDMGPQRTTDLRVRAIAACTALCLFVAVGVFAERAPHSSRDIASSITSLRRAGEPVIGWGVFPYDLQFYAHLSGELWIVDDWADPSLTVPDGWHKELSDAARFSPAGQSRLLSTADVSQLLSRAPAAWIVVNGTVPPAVGGEYEAREVARTSELSLWRVARHAH